MKLRYFYRIDHKKNPILGSNVRRKSKPSGNQWKEIIPICCDESPVNVLCSCGFRYFVQLDGKNKPVDYTIIKRMNKPDSDTGMKFMELPSNICCIVQTEFVLASDTPSAGQHLQVEVNDVVLFNKLTASQGVFAVKPGDTIKVTGGHTTGTYSFIVRNLNTNTNLYSVSPGSGDSTYTFVAEKGIRYSVTVDLNT